MPFAFDEVYSRLRCELLERHFAFGKFWRSNLFTNAAVLGEVGEVAIPQDGTVRHKCFVPPCVPRRSDRPLFDGDAAPVRVPDLERWRVWVRDRSNPLFMTGQRAVHLCVDHRLGAPHARTVVKLLLETTGSLFKWPEDSPFGGYVLRWDPATDDLWELRIDSKGRVDPMVPCRFLLNSDLKHFSTQRYLYCTPLDDPRYRQAVKDATADPERGMGVGQDRFRRWEPSKDEYLGLVAAYAMFFDTFSGDTSPDGQAIVEMVRSQCRRVAKYLQRFGYLVVRPCGGVAARGCGEIFPLLEFPFGKVFERILGDPHRSADGAYEAALATAGLSPWAAGGSLVAYVGGALSSALKGAFESIKDADGNRPEWAATAAAGLDEDHRKKAATLWEERDGVDAIGAESQNEPTAGFILASLSRENREKVYHQWFTSVGAKDNSSEDFKPLIALMLLDDDRTRRLYQDWFNAKFTRPLTSLPSPSHVPITDGARDTCFLTAIAMTIAHRRGDTAARDRLAQFVEEDARTMAREIVEHSRQTGTALPVNLVVQEGTACPPMNEFESEACATTGRKKLATELHDKRGGYFGLLPALALAWKHLLDGGPPIFSEITLPSSSSVSGWPEPVVPRAVIGAAGTDRMPVPTNAFSLSVPSPDGTQDVPLYRDPPPKPADNDIGARPRPRGEMRSIDHRGGVFATTVEETFPYPGIGVDPPESEEWSAAPAFAETEKTLIESHEFEKRDDRLVTKVKLRAVQANFGWNGFFPRVTFTYARLQGTYSLSWVRQR